MNNLSTELKGVIGRRLEIAGPREILAIASALCVEDVPSSPRPARNIEPRFEIEVYTDGEACRDNSTGLIWSRDNVLGERVNWTAAQEACEKLELGGFRDWRLPTIKELLTLVDYERHSPAIDTNAFKCESAWYWTSTPLKSSPSDCAWVVGFDSGLADWFNRDDYGFVRAVRVGQF